MTKHKSVIRLAEKPYKTIKWLTENYKYEVCAFGVGELVDGEMYIEKLVFPKQRVNSVHVEFDPADWGSLFPQLEGDEMDRIIFYWHKHPGCPTASSDDEANTFDVLMHENAGRKIFGFLQTAISGNLFKYEARIEVRDPVVASIMSVTLETDENDEIQEECQKLVKKYCIEPEPYVRPKYNKPVVPTIIKNLPATNALASSKFPLMKDLLLAEGEVCNVLRHSGNLYIVIIKNLDTWVEDEIGEYLKYNKIEKYHKDTEYIPGCAVFKLYGHGKELKRIGKQFKKTILEFDMGTTEQEALTEAEEMEIEEGINLSNEESALEELLDANK